MQMAFPSLLGTVPDNLAFVWEQIRQLASELKDQSQQMRTRALAGCDAKTILDYCATLANKKDEINVLAGTPGLAPYAQQQINNPNFDIVSEFNAMMAQVDTVRTWIVANFPKDANGYLLEATFDGNGRRVERQFPAASLTSFVTTIDGLLATIN